MWAKIWNLRIAAFSYYCNYISFIEESRCSMMDLTSRVCSVFKPVRAALLYHCYKVALNLLRMFLAI